MNHRRALYQYTDSYMAPTDDNFFEKLQDQNRNTTGMNSHEQETPKVMPMWSVALLFAAFFLVFIAWCLYTCFCACTSSQARQVSSLDQPDPQGDNNKRLTRTKRKSLVMEYFERSGNQMEVKAEHILHVNDDDCFEDIEKGVASEYDKEIAENHNQLGDPTTSTMEDHDDDNSVILVLDKTRAPIGPDSDFYQSPLQEHEENGIGGSDGSEEPQVLTHESLSSSSSSSPEAQEDEIMSCTMDNSHLQNLPTTSLPLHTYRQYVHDSCAICLEPYQEGDFVVWSCTESCPHVFHKTCFADYLASYRGPGTPCPSCRQPFIDEYVCNAIKNRPKRNTQDQTLSETPVSNESSVQESSNTATIPSNDQEIISIPYDEWLTP